MEIDQVHLDAVDKLNDIFGSVRFGKPEIRNQTYNPSWGEWCVRKLHYKITGASAVQRDTLRSLLRKEMGSAAHEVIQEWIKKALPDSLIEFITPNYKFLGAVARGRLDSILVGLNEYDYIAEIKTMDADRYDKAQVRVPGGYLFQMLMAAGLLQLWRPGILVLVNRNDGRLTAVPVDLRKEDWDKKYAWLRDIYEKHIKVGQAPPIPDDRNRYVCTTCEYFDHCFGDPEQRERRSGHLGADRIFGGA